MNIYFISLMLANVVSIILAITFDRLRPLTRIRLMNKLPLPLSDLFDILVFALCLLSVFWDPVDYFSLTFTQICAITVVSGSYFFDCTSWAIAAITRRSSLSTQVSDFSFPALVHHLAGAFGIAVLFWTSSGGGLLVRLLLDTATNLVVDVERVCVHRKLTGLSSLQWDGIFWLVYLLARCLWYPLVLVMALSTLYWHDPFPHILFYMLLAWTLFSTGVHFVEFIQDGIPILKKVFLSKKLR